MITQIKRKDCIEKFPDLPQRNYIKKLDDYEYIQTEVYARYVLVIKSKNYKAYLKSLSREMMNLLDIFNSGAFVFLGDEKLPWRFREGIYRAFDKDMSFLKEIGIGKRFSGGLNVPKKNLNPFIKHLTNLVGTNGIVQYVHFIDNKKQILGSICKYGNVHISTLTRESDFILFERLSKTKFELEENDCTYDFPL